MSSRTTTTLACDIDGNEDNVHTVPFSISSPGVSAVQHEIDLCESHERDLAGILAPFIGHARLVRPARQVRTPAGRARSGDIRAWAAKNNILLSDRGRIPAAVIRRYDAEHGK